MPDDMGWPAEGRRTLLTGAAHQFGTECTGLPSSEPCSFDTPEAHSILARFLIEDLKWPIIVLRAQRSLVLGFRAPSVRAFTSLLIG